MARGSATGHTGSVSLVLRSGLVAAIVAVLLAAAGCSSSSSPRSLDALAGTACNVGTPDQGVLRVTYGLNGSVAMTCVPKALETLQVAVNGGDGNDTVIGSLAGIDCGPRLATAVCSAQVPIDYAVTLTAQPDGTDVFSGWSVASCPGTPLSCTVTLNAAKTVTASFTAQHLLDWEVIIPTVSLGVQPSADLHIQPGDFSQHITAGTHAGSLMFPDGAVVRIDVTLNGVSLGKTMAWSGACAGALGNTCTVTMNAEQGFTAQLNLP